MEISVLIGAVGTAVTVITQAVRYVRACDRAMADFSIALHQHIAQSQADRQEFRLELAHLREQIEQGHNGSSNH